jgi:membrane associated rhomboid family serine protease
MAYASPPAEPEWESGTYTVQAEPPERLDHFGARLAAFTPVIWCTKAIVVVNIAIFAAMVANGVSPMQPDVQTMRDWGADFGPLTLGGQWWRAVTCMFLHFGIIHLGFNMWILWDIGSIVERLTGNVGMLLLYFISGVFASLVSLAWHPVVTSAGASGAVFGVCGALIGFLTLRRDTVPMRILTQLRGSLSAFLIYNVIFGLVVPGVDMAAHLGGLASGVVCGLVLSQPLTEGAIRRRWWRNSAVIAVGALMIIAGVAFLPPAPRDLQADLERLRQIETEVITTYRQAVSEYESDNLSEEGFAEVVEQDVLPGCQDAIDLLQLMRESPHVEPQVLAKFEQYEESFRSRLDGWRAIVRSIRDGDPVRSGGDTRTL